MSYNNRFVQKREDTPFNNFVYLTALKTNFQPIEYGNGYKLRCPAHDDTSPSLSASEGDDGRVLLYCFANCTYKDICAALQISPRDLFPPKKGVRRG